jgi:hypothetical protein
MRRCRKGNDRRAGGHHVHHRAERPLSIGRLVREAHGTYTGQIAGMPPGAGQSVTFRGASILELESGQIRVEREYYDAASLLAQLGALPGPGTPAP